MLLIGNTIDSFIADNRQYNYTQPRTRPVINVMYSDKRVNVVDQSKDMYFENIILLLFTEYV